MSIIKLLEVEEGVRTKPYLCSNGYPTVGVGKKIGPKCSQVALEQLYQFELPESVAKQWLLHDVQGLTDRLSRHPAIGFAFNSCNQARKGILISMSYQIGVEGLAKFENTIGYIEKREYENAAKEMLDSKWARKDSPSRAHRHAEQMRTGEWLDEYRG